MSQVIKAGQQGAEVVQLQQKLEKLGFPLTTDGIFGPNTRVSVEELQAMFGYNIDGAVGDATTQLIDAQIGYGFRIDEENSVKRALEAQGKKTDKGALAGAELVHALKRGSEGANVRYLQRRLNALGFTVDVDGKFGSGTEAAVRKLQEVFGYDIDGIVGKATHRLINAQIGYGFHLTRNNTRAQA